MVASKQTIADRVHIARRYARSVDLARDLSDPSALEGFVITTSVHEGLHRLMDGLREKSSQRAFRITGAYGSGKSSFGLLLARTMMNAPDAIEVLQSADIEKPAALSQYEPLVLVGRRTSFTNDLLDAIEQIARREKAVAVKAAVRSARCAREAGQHTPSLALDALDALAQHLKSKRGTGVLVMIDEMGRYLEFAASHPLLEDPSVFQLLAERAGGQNSAPLGVVAFLHHRFADYVAGMGEWIEAEWARSAERYEEIAFHESAEQTIYLLAQALQAKPAHDKQVLEYAHRLFREAGSRGLFSTSGAELKNLSAKLFPLHPATIIALSSITRRFGQNERSVFGFLQAFEPHGFRHFASTKSYGPKAWYQLAGLFDYLRNQGEIRFRSADRERRWHLALEAVAQASDMPEAEILTLKSLALLSVLEPVPGLRADDDCLAWCLNIEKRQIKKALKSLLDRNLIYRRPHRDDYSLWSSTSVDLDAWLAEARIKVPTPRRINAAASHSATQRPIIAHRHYHRTGTLRSFSVLTDRMVDHQGDGAIIVVPVHPDESWDTVRSTICQESKAAGPLTLFRLHAVSPRDLNWAHELALWQWVRTNCDELRVDDLARSEVNSRVAAAEAALSDILAPGAGLDGDSDTEKWIQHGKLVSLSSRGDLSRRLSDTCDKIFDKAPIVRNELVNRSRLSSAAASARMRLLELMIADGTKEYLGLEGAPPERTIYLSVFHASKLHQKVENGDFEFSAPQADPNNWGPVWDQIENLVIERSPIRFDELIAELAKAPFGLRAGPALLAIAAFMLAQRRHVTLMERNSFQPQVTGAHFMRLAKIPKNFALGHLGETPERRVLLERLPKEIAILSNPTTALDATVKSIVESIYDWWQPLPAFAKETRSLSKKTQAIRLTIQKATEPMVLLFEDLPRACDALTPTGEIDVDQFIFAFDESTQEMSDAEPILRGLATASLVDAFGATSFKKLRAQFKEDYAPLRLQLTDFRLRQLVERLLADGNDHRRLDGVAGLLAGRRIEAWDDTSLDTFSFEARSIADRLARWLIAVRKAQAQKCNLRTIHIVSTTGEEKVVVLRDNMPHTNTSLTTKIRKLLKDTPNGTDILGHLLAENLKSTTTKSEEDV